MQYSPGTPTSLHQRLQAEVRTRASSRHQANIADWAASNEGPIPTLEEATAVEFAATEVLLAALGNLARHAPDEVFPPTYYWDFTEGGWYP